MKHPTVFHVTHYKAGSQWVAEILKHSAPDRVVVPEPGVRHVRSAAIIPGAVYPTVYLDRYEVEAVLKELPGTHRIFVVIRDLRDTLVSLYFSMKISHAILNPRQQYMREVLQRVSMEEGLLKLVGRAEEQPVLDWLLSLSATERLSMFERAEYRHLVLPLTTAINAAIQRSWLETPVLHIRYEDLVDNEFAVFEQIIDYCEIEVPPDHLHNIIKYNTFEAVTGRARGEEDQAAHQRKGIAGDWRNYFTEIVKARFKERFGDLLMATGYAKDLDW